MKSIFAPWQHEYSSWLEDQTPEDPNAELVAREEDPVKRAAHNESYLGKVNFTTRDALMFQRGFEAAIEYVQFEISNGYVYP